MVATYKRVVAVQKELAELGARYGSHPDGWRTSGNVAERPNGGWEPGCGSEVSLEPSG